MDSPVDVALPEHALVFAFDKPHRVGSVCGNPCEQCGEIGVLYDTDGRYIEDGRPLFIRAIATESDWERSVIANGGVPARYPEDCYFYFVSTD